jgi:hypothetical protein
VFVTAVNAWSVVSTSRRAKGYAFGFVSVEERRVGPATQDPGKLPGQVHRIPDFRVHALSAYGAMDVGGISEQKRASFAEMLCDAMMNMVRGKPVHSADADRHPSHHARIDVVRCQRLALS